MLHQKTYRQLLRVIGQAMEFLNDQELDLTISGNEFVVSTQGPIQHSSWQRVREYFVRPSVPRQEDLVKRFRYTLADLEKLEREYRRLAVASDGMPDPCSLAQILRVVGSYVDQKQGTLLSLSKRKNSILVAYINDRSETVTDELLYLDVDGLFVREVSLRQKSHALKKIREKIAQP